MNSNNIRSYCRKDESIRVAKKILESIRSLEKELIPSAVSTIARGPGEKIRKRLPGTRVSNET